MPADEVITVPLDVEKIVEALTGKIGERADQLVEKYNLRPPIESRLLDGHGTQLLRLTVNWDEEGNVIEEGREAEWDFAALWKPEPGLFLSSQILKEVPAL